MPSLQKIVLETTKDAEMRAKLARAQLESAERELKAAQTAHRAAEDLERERERLVAAVTAARDRAQAGLAAAEEAAGAPAAAPALRAKAEEARTRLTAAQATLAATEAAAAAADRVIVVARERAAHANEAYRTQQQYAREAEQIQAARAAAAAAEGRVPRDDASPESIAAALATTCVYLEALVVVRAGEAPAETPARLALQSAIKVAKGGVLRLRGIPANEGAATAAQKDAETKMGTAAARCISRIQLAAIQEGAETTTASTTEEDSDQAKKALAQLVIAAEKLKTERLDMDRQATAELAKQMAEVAKQATEATKAKTSAESLHKVTSEITAAAMNPGTSPIRIADSTLHYEVDIVHKWEKFESKNPAGTPPPQRGHTSLEMRNPESVTSYRGHELAATDVIRVFAQAPGGCSLLKQEANGRVTDFSSTTSEEHQQQNAIKMAEMLLQNAIANAPRGKKPGEPLVVVLRGENAAQGHKVLAALLMLNPGKTADRSPRPIVVQSRIPECQAPAASNPLGRKWYVEKHLGAWAKQDTKSLRDHLRTLKAGEGSATAVPDTLTRGPGR